jgi:hypothetical protein
MMKIVELIVAFEETKQAESVRSEKFGALLHIGGDVSEMLVLVIERQSEV